MNQSIGIQRDKERYCSKTGPIVVLFLEIVTMFSDIFKRRFSHPLPRGLMLCILGLMLLIPMLAACNNPVQFVPVNLGIPSQALNSPLVGPLPDATKLHVGLTFKVSDSVINKLSSQVHPHQPSHLE